MNNTQKNETHSDCHACMKNGVLTAFMAPETLCQKHRAEFDAKEKKTNTSFVFSDPRFEEYPEIKRQLAAETQHRLGELIEQKEADILFLQLQKLNSIGYDVQIKKLPTESEKMNIAVEEARERGFEQGQRSIMRKVEKVAPVAIAIASYTALIGSALLYGSGIKRGAKDLKTELVGMGLLGAAKWYFRR